MKIIASEQIRNASSVDHFIDFLAKFVNSWRKTHVHKLRLCVHLKASENSFINLEFNNEFFAFVLWVGLECSKNLLFFFLVQSVSRNDGNLFFFVELLIKLLELFGDFFDEHKSLVFSKNFNEFVSNSTEICSFLKRLVELFNFLKTNSCILGEELESFRVFVQLTKVNHIFVNIIKNSFLRSSGEENWSISAWNSVFLRGRLNEKY